MSTPPPSYDETGTDAPPYSAQRNSLQSSQPSPTISNFILDDTLIRSAKQPELGAYRLTHALDCGFSTIGISRLVPLGSHRQSTTSRTYERHLYDFSKPVFSNDVEIVGKRRGALHGTVIFKPYHGLMRTGWEVLHETKDGRKLILRTRPTRRPARKSELQWEDGRRSLVAVETQMHSTPDCRPRFHVVAPLDETMADILVTAWCARIWSIYRIMEAAGKVEDFDSGTSTPYSCSCRDCHVPFLSLPNP